MTDTKITLRTPFPPHLVSKLNKGQGVILDYVGHAALTSRLLDVDPGWSWEPMALSEQGLPMFDASGGLWIRLTVNGVTRIGYGNAKAKKDPGDREKEIIGDALRNAAMRFGAALDLWHKGDLNGPQEEEQEPADLLAQGGAAVRAGELITMYLKAQTLAEVDEVTAMFRAEWKEGGLRTVKGLSEKIVEVRTEVQKRLSA